MDRQCPSCGGFCKKSGCERENVRPQREWVGLTDEERAECWSTSAVQSALNIEAKLKEKNCSAANNS